MTETITENADRSVDATIDARLRRLEDAVARRPGFGVRSQRSVTTLGDGLRCVTEDGAWRIDTDLSDHLGGTDSAPSPSALVRAALSSCMAMTYRLRAARRGVPVRSVRVTVETETAIAGMLDATSNEPAGFRTLRFHVDIDSPAPQADVMRIIEEGDALSPVLDIVSSAVAVQRTVTVTSTRTEVA